MAKNKIPFLTKLTLTLISIIALGYLLVIGKFILAPVFLALLLAFLFTPFADLLEQKLHFGRAWSTLCSLLLMLILLTGLGYFFGTQLADFRSDIPQLIQQSNHVFHELQVWVRDTFHIDINNQFDYLNQVVGKVLSSSGVILGVTFTVFSSTLMFFFFAILFSIFILRYRASLYMFIIQVFSGEYKEQVEEAVREIQNMTKNYLLGVCFQIIIVTALTTAGLSILGVKYAFLLGVVTGLLNVIPYVGIAISLVISTFITFATANPITCLYVLILYIIVHSIDGNITIPFVIGSRVKINPLFSFLGIVIGEQLWGIAGMFLCIPAMAIMRIIFERVDELKPWGFLLGDAKKKKTKKRKVKITQKWTLEEKE